MIARLAVAAALLLAAGCQPGQAPAAEGAAPAAAGETAAGTPAPAAAEAARWMANNARQPGVRTLPSGLQYKVVRSGPATGPHPGPRDEVKVHYEGTLIDGTVFDSSYQQGAPAVMVVERLVPAWQQALPMMRPGDEWILFVPPELGYGDRGGGPIPPNSILVFRLELLDVLPRGGASQFG